MVFQNHLPDGLFLVLIHRIIQDCQPILLIRKFLSQFFRVSSDIRLSDGAVVRKDSLFHFLLRNLLSDRREQFFRNGAADIVMLGFPALRHDGVYESNNFLICLIRQINGLDHLCLRNLIGSGLDHDDLISGGRDGQLKIGNGVLLQRRIDNQLSVNHSDLRRSAGTVKRNIGNRCRDRRSQHGNNLRIAVRIHRHYHVVQGHIVPVILREKRTHGAVNDTGGKNRVLGSLALALVEASWNFTHRVHLLLVLYRERKEIHALSGLPGCGRRTKQCCIAIMHKGGSICLFCHTADLHLQRSSRQIHGIGLIRIFQFRRKSFCFVHFSDFSSFSSSSRLTIHPAGQTLPGGPDCA